MKGAPSFDDIFAVMAAASVGHGTARVTVPDDPQLDHEPTRFAMALNVLLDDLAYQLKAVERMAGHQRLLAEASQEFAAATKDPDRLYPTIVRRLASVVCDLSVVLMASTDGRHLTLTALHGTDDDARRRAEAAFSEPLPIDRHPMTGRVHESGKPLLIANFEIDPPEAQPTPEATKLARALGIRSIIIVPLLVEERSVGQALLVRYRPTQRPFDEDDLQLASGLAVHASLVIANARSHATELRAERARSAAESRFTRLEASGILGIFVATLDARIIEVNDALLDIVGYSRDEILSGAVVWKDLTPEEWRPIDQRAIDELLSTGVASLREKEFLRKDGSRVPVLLGTAMLEGEGRECIGFVLDLRGSKRMEAAIERLREAYASEATFRSFLEGAPDAAVIVNREGRIVRVNSQTERLFGYSRDELLQQPDEMLVPERFRGKQPQYRAAFFANAKMSAKAAGQHLLGLRKDGTEFPVEISVSPLETREGTLLSSTIRDISARRRIEEQRFRLAAIVEASDDAIIGKTLQGIITTWNEGAHRLFGYSAEEIVGRPISCLIPADRQAEEQTILDRLARGLTARFDSVRMHKDGHEIHVSVTSSPMRDASGTVIGASKVVRDITARRRAEEALARAKDAAEAATRELEAFSYSVAHDLRAPLRGMNGFAQVLLDTHGDKLDPEGQDCLQEIVVNARKMGELIDALLSLARLTRSDLARERIDISSVVRATAHRLAVAQPDRKVELTVEDHLTAAMDPVLAQALIDNLLGNAWKFTSKVPVARIAFGQTHSQGTSAFFVRDNGAGFDMAFAGKLFAPFQRLHTLAEFPGTGIGLATVQRIVHRHGGRVWAEGAVDAGATFYFALPQVASEDRHDQGDSAHRRQS